MNEMILVYITCSRQEEAKKVGMHLLKKRIAACFNIIDGMKSAYWWPPKGNAIEEAEEVILIVKTLKNKFVDVEREVASVHASDTPCIIAIPTVAVSQKYFHWIEGEIA